MAALSANISKLRGCVIDGMGQAQLTSEVFDRRRQTYFTSLRACAVYEACSHNLM